MATAANLLMMQSVSLNARAYSGGGGGDPDPDWLGTMLLILAACLVAVPFVIVGASLWISAH